MTGVDMSLEQVLPLIFITIMGFSMLIYVVSDGYDLGVGMLMHRATPEERDVMVDSIGPFWDANETWLVLGVGVLLIAFPKAHGLILTELYLPTAFMLVGLILRGAAFDFRVKARSDRKIMWDRLFIGGSMLASVAQGWMLGRYISGFGTGWNYPVFAAAIALALPMSYALLGASWIIMKTDGPLQARAIGWAKIAWPAMIGGLVLISMATPWVSETVRARWFALPALIAVIAIPITTGVTLLAVRLLLGSDAIRGNLCWLPVVLLIFVYFLSFLGLSYSLFPFVVIDRLTIWEAASSPAALKAILVGVCISLPAIVAYTIFSYRVFRGKIGRLHYA
jgi:cytochrome d ubiquinol oxidase subunit II